MLKTILPQTQTCQFHVYKRSLNLVRSLLFLFTLFSKNNYHLFKRYFMVNLTRIYISLQNSDNIMSLS